MPRLGDQVRHVLAHSFVIRTTVTRRSGAPRTVETTYVWDGQDRIYLSGYPGKRDWVASMAASPWVTVHTVEGTKETGWYDIPASARVLRDRDERLPHLLAFVERWAKRPGFPRLPFQFALATIRLNRQLHLPWWGPFYPARKLLDQMPCVELTFTGDPVARSDGPSTAPWPEAGRP